MRRRSERQQDFELIKQNLFSAGVSTVKAAKAQEEMFTTTLEALTEAYEGIEINQLEAAVEEPTTNFRTLADPLITQRQAAIANGDYDGFVEVEKKLQQLDELAVIRVERQVRLLTAQQKLAQLTASSKRTVNTDDWTEAALKQEYRTVADVRKAFGIKARTWKDAVEQVNQQANEFKNE